MATIAFIGPSAAGFTNPASRSSRLSRLAVIVSTPYASCYQKSSGLTMTAVDQPGPSVGLRARRVQNDIAVLQRRKWHRKQSELTALKAAPVQSTAERFPVTDTVTEAFIVDGPIFRTCNPSKRDIDMEEWRELGRTLEKLLGPDQANAERIFRYYLPIFFWLEQMKVEQSPDAPYVVGLSCPQGGGKTTITEFMQELFKLRGQVCVVASIDDFYKTRSEQQKVASTYTGNRLLELRGNPGTHDIPLALEFLDSVKAGKANLTVPRYDKSAFGGLGDRAPEDQWVKLSEEPADIVLLEGWCLGFSKLSDEQMREQPQELQAVNKYMDEFSQLYGKLDLLMIVKIADTQWVFDWRAQAETMMKSLGKTGMSDEQVRDFVSRFMPSYKAYLPGLYASPPAENVLLFEIDQQRVPVGAELMTARSRM
ncbi:D-glycerate 3-kinase, chloroplastic [Porphyridium purpureum]|uniref:D-glycerate 3-kinase, chloroplastic n=1 Tax=Porphyridium purpureum TaxID=35688 RepID=A0A5J4YZZ7_PORPP|nr:D-glycerate 3-kinase, chloroplastic [Porphyridium purpureum]|eukprot:POR5670..scf208_2